VDQCALISFFKEEKWDMDDPAVIKRNSIALDRVVMASSRVLKAKHS
jgi:hypothetical protein